MPPAAACRRTCRGDLRPGHVPLPTTAYYPAGNATITSHRCKTNTVSNTAFRGFGGPQGMIAIERVIDEIAFALGKDPLDVGKVNFYGTGGRGT